MRWLPVLAAAGGAGAIALLASQRSARASRAESSDSWRGAVAPPAGPLPEAEPASQQGASPPLPRVVLQMTKYWPYTAAEHEKAMEGGTRGAAMWRGRKAIDPGTGRRPELYTLEMAQSGKAPYASLAGDPTVWPFGQRIEIDAWPGIVFRVVDTGGNFRGKGKEYRGRGEPIDVCVHSKKTKVPATATAQIVAGDNFEGGAAVAVSQIRSQSLVAGDSATPGNFDADCEALGRAIESSCRLGSIYEKQAIAWACRNRAASIGTTVQSLLAPEGVYGPRGEGGRDFASTALPAGVESSQVARAVLLLPQADDPTDGAIDFWNPAQQRRARVASEMRALIGGGDLAPSEDDARAALIASGLRPGARVGDVELLYL